MNHLQEVLLVMAKDIDILCQKHGITYYLDGGSALGAVRHRGFIPWDDDFDIIMPPEDYKKFLEVCKSDDFDHDKYTLQEAFVDWNMHFSKIRLNNTSIEEIDADPNAHKGIFIDIFCFDYGSNYKLVRAKQYICAKLWMAYLLSNKPYSNLSLSKKLAMTVAKLLKWKPLRHFVRTQSQTSHPTKFYSIAWGRKRWHNAFLPVDFFDGSKRVKFEDYEFPIATKTHEYLSNTFGDYMKLPPESERQGSHAIKVDFGPY